MAGFDSRIGAKKAGVAIAVLSSVLPSAALAMPPDPNRPLTQQTCAIAMERLAEARAGSPLLSSQEQAEVLTAALADVQRLCRGGNVDGLPDPTSEHAQGAIAPNGPAPLTSGHFPEDQISPLR